MTERRLGAETLQDNLKFAYDKFNNLAKTYGVKSDEGGFTFKKYIHVPGQKQDNVVSGRNFGTQSHTVEVFYRIGSDAFQLTLSKDQLGNVSIAQAIAFDTKATSRGNVLVQSDDSQKKPDIQALNTLLITTAAVCDGEKQVLQKRLKAAMGLGITAAEKRKIERSKKAVELKKSTKRGRKKTM